jgi:hypothetical protein
VAKLTYVVIVESDDPKSDVEYLEKLRKTFQMISEELAGWGYVMSETTSSSSIVSTEPTDTEA